MDSYICFVCKTGLASQNQWRVIQLCGHVFHGPCLLNSFQSTKKGEQQKCPQCSVPCQFNETNCVYPTPKPVPAAAPAPVVVPAPTKCPKNCGPNQASRLWCLKHRRCNSACREYRHPCIRVFSFQSVNGCFYCEKCVRMTCPQCNGRLDGDCVMDVNEWIYHDRCFRCIVCTLPLDLSGESLTKKSNRYHNECLNCYVCGNNVCGEAYWFDDNAPRCVGCIRPESESDYSS